MSDEPSGITARPVHPACHIRVSAESLSRPWCDKRVLAVALHMLTSRNEVLPSISRARWRVGDSAGFAGRCPIVAGSAGSIGYMGNRLSSWLSPAYGHPMGQGGAPAEARHQRSAVALVATVVVLAGCSTPLATSSVDPPSGSRYFRLPDGTAAVSTVRQNSIEVRWRGADEHNWSDPVDAYSDGDRVITLMRIRVAGPTLAIQATTSPPDTVYSDEETAADLAADDTVDLVVCRDESCDAAPPYDDVRTEVPALTPDGTAVLLGVAGDRYVVWQDGGAVDELEATGLAAARSTSLPLFVPDGSFRVLTGSPTAAGCRFCSPPSRTRPTTRPRRRTSCPPREAGVPAASSRSPATTSS
jgi:hypothetical protein